MSYHSLNISYKIYNEFKFSSSFPKRKWLNLCSYWELYVLVSFRGEKV